jgi:hypothetical protein
MYQQEFNKRLNDFKGCTYSGLEEMGDSFMNHLDLAIVNEVYF